MSIERERKLGVKPHNNCCGWMVYHCHSNVVICPWLSRRKADKLRRKLAQLTEVNWNFEKEAEFFTINNPSVCDTVEVLCTKARGRGKYQERKLEKARKEGGK